MNLRRQGAGEDMATVEAMIVITHGLLDTMINLHLNPDATKTVLLETTPPEITIVRMSMI